MRFDQVKRREFITLLGGTVACPVAARAQQATIPIVGILLGVSAPEWAMPLASLRRGLSETGFFEGRNVSIQQRSADGQFDCVPRLLAELIGLRVAVIFIGGNTPSVRAAISATTIPIVFSAGIDPVAAGLVHSLNRPGGNATGITFLVGEIGPKQLDLLRELTPNATKIALLTNPRNPLTSDEDIQGIGAAASRIGLEIIVLNGSSEEEIEKSFATAVQNKANALLVGSDAYFQSRRDQISALGLRHSLPIVAPLRSFADAGVLMSYGADHLDGLRQVGVYIGRILKGEKPADLPVLQPTKFTLVLNLKTAKALGLTVPDKLLALADEVIE
jgi:putative tryptophan/tyrosine transport system substrate-binding protein